MHESTDRLKHKIDEWKKLIIDAEKYIELAKAPESIGKCFEELKSIEDAIENTLKVEHGLNVTSLISSAESIQKNGEVLSDEFLDIDGYNGAASVYENCIGTIKEYCKELDRLINKKKDILTSYEEMLMKLNAYINYKKR